MDDRIDVLVGIGREHGLADAGRHHRYAAADLGERAHDLAAFHAGQHNDRIIIDHRKICGFSGLVAQLAQIRHGLRHEVAATGEGGPYGKTLCADMPFRFIAIELHEAALFQGRQQAMNGRSRQAGADGKIA